MLRHEEYTMLSTLLSEPHRKYHNINHINDCLVELEQFSDPLLTKDLRTSVEAAIWYHDSIYNPYSKKNEENSAKLAAYHHEPIVRDMILRTAFHLVDQKPDIVEDYNDPGERLAVQLMLDIDLAGFGKDRFVFATNGMNIRHEYYNTQLVDFLKGRMSFYAALVKRPTLYYTPYFCGKYHAKSRENIEWEMSLLEQALKHNNPDIWSRAMMDALDDY